MLRVSSSIVTTSSFGERSSGEPPDSIRLCSRFSKETVDGSLEGVVSSLVQECLSLLRW